MAVLPDELWRKILEIGVQSCGFTYKDLCCLSISCRRLRRLSDEDPFWSHLLSSDFPFTQTSCASNFLDSYPSSSTSPSSKSLYKIRFEKEKERRIAAHRRAVFRKKSQIAEHFRKLRDIESRINQESNKMRESAAELSNLRKVRQASAALNVWQPEVIRGRQKQLVEQCVVPTESRIHALEMELRLCRQQIMNLKKSHKDEKHRLDTAKEELSSLNYHPVREHKSESGGENSYYIKPKKLKRCHSCEYLFVLSLI
ncbi:F-box protein SKIP24-like isoform X3 [Neltuma alba]|uniref:F-box protein SKIP24 isoform X3 n=1 Tax=Neltuma alba TaxID=207710 RepID=UPI0010A34869|nr:F-box protein SKIP24-like isoform X3 [Prosopis alba]XP_028774860.1 F-box protein SKIP24-like isoform X3 [Prosopis alba]